MAAPIRQTACSCEEFTDALRVGFLRRIGEQFYLADLESGSGMSRSAMYGPAITHCPFCGAMLGKPGELPRAQIRRS